LQTGVLAPHLHHLLAPRIHGIDNGLFADPAVDRTSLREAMHGRPEALLAWKADRRLAFLAALRAITPGGGTPVWGDPRRFAEIARGDAPWFAFAGRDDSRQKGYDVAAVAVEAVLDRNGEAQFLFFPMPGDEGTAGLAFLRELAEESHGHVLVLPFRFAEGYA